MKQIFDPLLRILGSLKTSFALVLMLAVLTWLGTLEQVEFGLYEVQKKYFESLFLVHRAGPIAIPLPGGGLVMGLLGLNLLVGGLIKLRWRAGTIGVGVIHIGIAFLLYAGYVKLTNSEDGHVTLYPDEHADSFQSYQRWELVIGEELEGGQIKEHLVPQEDFLDAGDARGVTLVSDELPFDLELTWYTTHCRPTADLTARVDDRPVLEGRVLAPLEPMKEAEQNIAGGYLTVRDKDGEGEKRGILWAFASDLFAHQVDDKLYVIGLRKERYPLPFDLELEVFTKEDHPGTSMPRVFSSEVTVRDEATERRALISMNEPLREAGLVLYQASWGPQNARPGEPLFSTLAVVRNPADRYPLISCIIIGAGMLLHFGAKLLRHVKRQAAQA